MKICNNEYFFLQNIVACGAGFVDGLGMGDNTKAAVIRLGLMEMIKFVDVFYPGSKLSTFFESCGVADLITTCYGKFFYSIFNILFYMQFILTKKNYYKTGGRNRKVCEAFIKSGKTIKQLEEEMLNGQKLQGPITAEEVNFMLRNKKQEEKYKIILLMYQLFQFFKLFILFSPGSHYLLLFIEYVLDKLSLMN